MNQLLFKRVYLDADDDGPFVAPDPPTESVTLVRDAAPRARGVARPLR